MAVPTSLGHFDWCWVHHQPPNIQPVIQQPGRCLFLLFSSTSIIHNYSFSLSWKSSTKTWIYEPFFVSEIFQGIHHTNDRMFWISHICIRVNHLISSLASFKIENSLLSEEREREKKMIKHLHRSRKQYFRVSDDNTYLPKKYYKVTKYRKFINKGWNVELVLRVVIFSIKANTPRERIIGFPEIERPRFLYASYLILFHNAR